jgi:S1-C subfamily serine protease
MSKVNSRISIPIWVITLSVLLVVLGVIGATNGVAPGARSQVVSAMPALYDEQVVISIFESTDPAVVEIAVVLASSSRSRLFIPQGGQGSGFLVDTEGHILTNYHVIQGATSIRVTLFNGRTVEAQVAGASPADDIALLKVNSAAVEGIVPLTLGDSSTVKPGQMAIALGSPFGLESTITVGVVSGVERSRTGILQRPITGMIQTDALINPGNSGGPLVDSQGEVMGINTSIETTPSGITGIGFAVPINTAKALMTRLVDVENETVKRPWLGISGGGLSPAFASAFDLGVSQGVYVATVAPDSPAQAAGLVGEDGGNGATGDVITAVEGNAVSSVEDLVEYFNIRQPGDSVSLTLVRGGLTFSVTVVLGEWPDGF